MSLEETLSREGQVLGIRIWKKSVKKCFVFYKQYKLTLENIQNDVLIYCSLY
jgi:hypothetical protein